MTSPDTTNDLPFTKGELAAIAAAASGPIGSDRDDWMTRFRRSVDQIAMLADDIDRATTRALENRPDGWFKGVIVSTELVQLGGRDGKETYPKGKIVLESGTRYKQDGLPAGHEAIFTNIMTADPVAQEVWRIAQANVGAEVVVGRKEYLFDKDGVEQKARAVVSLKVLTPADSVADSPAPAAAEDPAAQGPIRRERPAPLPTEFATASEVVQAAHTHFGWTKDQVVAVVNELAEGGHIAPTVPGQARTPKDLARIFNGIRRRANQASQPA